MNYETFSTQGSSELLTVLRGKVNPPTDWKFEWQHCNIAQCYDKDPNLTSMWRWNKGTLPFYNGSVGLIPDLHTFLTENYNIFDMYQISQSSFVRNAE